MSRSRLTLGIELSRMSFSYPGTERLALDDITLHMPAGSVVAIVGENGAGKSTLIKLLTKMYEPSSGRGARRRPTCAGWLPTNGERGSPVRSKTSTASSSQRSAVSDWVTPRLDDEAAVSRAVDRAGATDVVDRLPEGCKANWVRPGQRQELSFGQWQKLALSGATCARNHC